MQKLRHKILLSVLMIAVLSACGGQPALEENQAVTPTPVPEVEKHSSATVSWRASSSGSKTGGAHFEPLVQDDQVFVASRSGRIESFSLKSGDREINIKLDETLVSGVGVNAASIIAVTTGGNVVAFKIDDGSEKWRHSVGRSISAAPAVNDQIVVIRTIDGHVIGLNALTGERIWGLERPVASLSVGQDASSLLAGEGVISGFSSGRVLANSIATGGTFWEKRAFRPSGKNDIERLIDIDAPPALVGRTVLLGAFKGGLVAYRLRNGEEAWRNDEASTRKPIAVSQIAVAITGPQSDVSLLDITNGEIKWQQSQLKGHGLTAPVILSDALVVGSLTGEVYFLDLDSGDILSHLKLGKSPITALRKVEQGIVVYSANSGALSLIQL